MIDWLSFSVPYRGPRLCEAYFRKMGEGDCFVPAYEKGLAVEGSWSSNLLVQTKGDRLYVSVNPSKWLTGQNVVGTNDAPLLVRAILHRMFINLGINDPGHLCRSAVARNDVSLTRVDCTEHYHVGSDDDVATFISALEASCHVKFRGRGHYDSSMCAIRFGVGADANGRQKASRRSTFKFYNKHRELMKHPMTCNAEYFDELNKLAYGVVRGEACYRALELKAIGRENLMTWNMDTALELHREWIDKMEITGNVELLGQLEEKLPLPLLMTYRSWINGEDCRALMTRRTFYRRRRELLEFGVDIGLPRIVERKERRVVPVVEVLRAVPVNMERHEALFREMMTKFPSPRPVLQAVA